jgi:hypothetical protein
MDLVVLFCLSHKLHEPADTLPEAPMLVAVKKQFPGELRAAQGCGHGYAQGHRLKLLACELQRSHTL